MSDKTDITPDTKVGHLLESYPELKEVLFEITPAFKKLNNPILLKTVAKVTSLKQAAQVGKVNLPEMINRLRAEVGLKLIDIAADQSSYSNQKPEWFDPENIIEVLDARPMIDKGEQPIGEVLKSLRNFPVGKIYELITPFVPAPLIDKVDKSKIAVYQDETDDNLVKTYFYNLKA